MYGKVSASAGGGANAAVWERDGRSNQRFHFSQAMVYFSNQSYQNTIRSKREGKKKEEANKGEAGEGEVTVMKVRIR